FWCYFGIPLSAFLSGFLAKTHKITGHLSYRIICGNLYIFMCLPFFLASSFKTYWPIYQEYWKSICSICQ
ncbi:MAG: hypothetical protein KDC92_04160, partial [Bacteroidetes bacterium]|nr:hypothetical protein [Bacteroidota bacterium]